MSGSPESARDAEGRDQPAGELLPLIKGLPIAESDKFRAESGNSGRAHYFVMEDKRL